ncbi:MAG: hypothetical protein KJ558_09480 [Gammaproteobacteria bacterium]|nr:hypothetical protein [Gammaproteobacteria bacterium]MBU1655037.1 hypothetical protein [Gammaproteobacteria bacterium]MBU1961534.1 hypothetical protein [Gammaproteobacteria bacterium]
MINRKYYRSPLALALGVVLSLAAVLITYRMSGEDSPMAEGQDNQSHGGGDFLAKLEGPLAAWAKEDRPGPIAVLVVLEKGGDAPAVIARIGQLGGRVTTQFEGNIYAEVPAAALAALAGDPNVWGVRPTPVHDRIDSLK